MTDYTRVTIQGEGRKADLVLPDDEPIAAVLPEVLSLLDETTERSSRPVVLMTTVGEQLSPALTLAEQEVEHGTILRLVRVDEAPPPPEVADVTDLMGAAVETRSDAWRPAWGVGAAAAIAAIIGFLGGPAAILNGFTAGQVGLGFVVLLALAVFGARRRHTG
ncbi:EsaB/YukD family protein, partial [Pseudactinotalea sp.]|uniref:EsaB/YukD family protein n=1 Tax=Pseudactinotalea sp. TaxID=1926260 RepID=UPI003B3B9801